MTSPETWNQLRFDPKARRGHVESYFLKANDPLEERAIWVKATIFVASTEPDRPIAEAWAIAFDRRPQRPGSTSHAATEPAQRMARVAVKQVIPFDRATFRRDGLGILLPLGESERVSPRTPAEVQSVERLSLMPGEVEGLIRTGRDTISFRLGFGGRMEPLVPFFSQSMYEGAFPRSKPVSPYPDVRFDGEVVVNGDRWPVAGWRGMQGHNWGRGHAELYAWCHANQWAEDPSFLLEGFSARVRVGPVRTPLTTIVCARHEGESYDFNLPFDIARASADVTNRTWEFAAKNRRARIEGSIETHADEMVGLYYPNPDGPMTYCLNSKLAEGRVRFEVFGRAPIELTTRSAALEIGTQDDEHGVKMFV